MQYSSINQNISVILAYRAPGKHLLDVYVDLKPWFKNITIVGPDNPKISKSVLQSMSYSMKRACSSSGSLTFFENSETLKAYLFVSFKIVVYRASQSYKLQHRCRTMSCLSAAVYAPYDSNEVISSALNVLNPVVSPQNHSGNVR